MRPLIGLNLDVNVQKPSDLRIARAYIEAVEQAGGVPILIPPMKTNALKKVLKKIDGLILIGGRDYSPETYGKRETRDTNISPLHPVRQEFDLRLAQRALTDDKLPILGICGGMQLLNIALGGTLVEDIPTNRPSNIAHRSAGPDPTTHAVALTGKLAKIYNAERVDSVVTSHHQAVDRLAEGLSIEALADDGIIEGFVHTDADFVVGVQWHPEKDYSGSERLFKALIKHAKKRASDDE